MTRKRLHQIVVNELPKRCREYTIEVRGREGEDGKLRKWPVKLQVGKDKLAVSCELSSNKKPDGAISGWSWVLSRGLKTAMVLHVLLYGQTPAVRKVYWRLGDGDLSLSPLKDQFVYWLFDGRLRKLNDGWKQEPVIATYLSLAQKDRDYRLAALHAYLMGKSCTYETQRFMYLWMAMNGLYEFYNKEVLEKNDYGEQEHIRRFQSLFAPNRSFLNDSDRNKCFEMMNSYVFGREQFVEDIKDPESELSKKIEKGIRDKTKKYYTIHVYYYYLLQQAYAYRCNLFHANRPIKLLSYPEESELIVLRTLSDLMEEFLDNNLHKWFDESYIERIKEGKDLPLDPFVKE